MSPSSWMGTGVEAARRVVKAAPDLNIGTLTLYAFSSDNWQRPQPEVAMLLRLLHEYLLAETDQWVACGVSVAVMGRRDRLPRWLREAIEAAELAPAAGASLRLRLAVDYSAREAIFSRRLSVLQGHGGIARFVCRGAGGSEPRWRAGRGLADPHGR